MPDKRYTKVEEEIIQILDRLESEEPAARPQLRIVPSRPKRSRTARFRRPTFTSRPAWFWLALSFALAAAAYFARDVSSTIALLFAIASAAVFFGPLFSRGPAVTPTIGSSTTKTWRGKDITLPPSGRGNTGDRARRWLDDRRGGPRKFR